MVVVALSHGSVRTGNYLWKNVVMSAEYDAAVEIRDAINALAVMLERIAEALGFANHRAHFSEKTVLQGCVICHRRLREVEARRAASFDERMGRK